MLRPATIGTLLLAAIALALPYTLEPSAAVIATLWAATGVLAVTLLGVWAWNSDRVWAAIATKLQGRLELPAAAAPPPVDDTEERRAQAAAVGNILDELSSAELDLVRAQKRNKLPEWFSRGFASTEYHNGKAHLPPEVREKVGRAYVRMDHLAGVLQDRSSPDYGDGSFMVRDDDDLGGVIAAVRAARIALRSTQGEQAAKD